MPRGGHAADATTRRASTPRRLAAHPGREGQIWDDASQAPQPPRSGTGTVILVAALVSAVTVTALHHVTDANGVGRAERVLVPEVVGMSIVQAQLAAESTGLALRVL